MISYIQNFLGKHHKWFFSILLVVIIVAFVFTIGNMGTGAPTTAKAQERIFYGYNLNNPSTHQNLRAGVRLDMLMQYGQVMNLPEEMMESQIKTRAASLFLANQTQIPSPNSKQYQQYLKSQPILTDADGNFQKDRLQSLLSYSQQALNISTEGFDSLMSENWRIDQVLDAVGGPGYVLPWEAKNQVIQQKATWTIQVAKMPKADFQPEIELSQEEIEQYYNLNKENYQVSEKVALEYVKFDASRYMDSITPPTQEEIENYYNTNKRRYTTGTGEDETVTPLEDVRMEITQALRLQKAANKAASAAQDWISELHREDVEQGTSMFEDRLASENVQTQSIEPFSRGQSVAGAPVSARALQIGFSLNERNWYSDALPVADGAVVLIYKEEIPATIPPLEEIRESVISDLKEQRRNELFREKAEKIANQLDDGFDAKASELGLATTSHEDFSIGSPPAGLNSQLLGQLPAMREGQVSDPIINGEAANFIYVSAKELPEISDDVEELDQARENFANYSSRITAGLILQNLIEAGDAQLDAQDKAQEEAN